MHRSHRTVLPLLPLVCVGCLLGSALRAQDGSVGGPAAEGPGPVSPASVIHTNLTGDPSAAVPGLPGVQFKPSPTSSAQFDRVYGNRLGNYAFTALVDLATTNDEVLIADGLLLAQEGSPIPGLPGENYGLLDTRLGVSEVATVVLAVDSSGPTTGDELILSLDLAGNPTVVAREGQPMFAIPGATYGSSLDTPFLLANGTAGLVANLFTGPGITTATDEILEIGGLLIAQSGVTVPGNQAGGGAEFLEIIDLTNVYASADGAHVLISGDLTGAAATDDVIIVDGVVVLQGGTPLPEFTSPVSAAATAGSYMDASGGWMARGSNDDGQDWVVRNGRVVAFTGGRAIAGSNERYDDAEFAACFFAQVSNGLGDYVIGGVTDGPTASNGVVVLNGTTVILREGDPIDLNGNTLADDDTFFNTFGNDDFHLSDNGILYFMATIRNAAGTGLGQGFFSLTLALAPLEPCAVGTVVEPLLGRPSSTLFINGSDGGGSHRVPIPVGFDLTLDLLTPPGVVAADYALFVRAGVPSALDVLSIPGIGDLCFAPCLIPGLPGATSLTLAASIPGLCPPIVPTGPAPFSLTVPGGVGIPLQLALEAVSLTPGGVLISNTVLLEIQ